MKRVPLPGGYSPTFYLAFLASVLFFSSGNLLLTPVPLYVQELGGSAAQVGLAQMAFAVSAIVVRPYLGRLADLRGRKPVLLIGTAVFTIAPLFYTQISTVPALQLARFFHGIGIAAFTSGYYPLIADVTPPSRWGAALGLAGIAPSLSMVVASPVGATLLQHCGFTVAFLAAGLTALAGLVVALVIGEPSQQHAVSASSASSSVGLLDVIKLRGVIAPALATLTLGVTSGTVFTFVPLFAPDRGLGNSGLFFTAMSLSSMTSTTASGRLSDRWGRLAVILPMLGVLAMSIMGLNWAYGSAMLLAMAVFLGVGSGGTRIGLETTAVHTAPAEARARAMSLVYFCFDVGIAVGSLAMGAVADITGYGQGYLGVGVLCLLTLVFFGGAMRKPQSG
jgi:predicted MFS family arabinose efflux permease